MLAARCPSCLDLQVTHGLLKSWVLAAEWTLVLASFLFRHCLAAVLSDRRTPLRGCEEIGEAKLAHTISCVRTLRGPQRIVAASSVRSIHSQPLRERAPPWSEKPLFPGNAAAQSLTALPDGPPWRAWNYTVRSRVVPVPSLGRGATGKSVASASVVSLVASTSQIRRPSASRSDVC